MNIQFLAEGDNLVFAGKEGLETVSSMYLAPFVTNVGDEICMIRNVYTKSEYRRKGCMDKLMKEAFACMQSEAEPYSVLRPYNEKYFLPYGFADIIDRPYETVNSDRIGEDKLDAMKQGDESFEIKGGYFIEPVSKTGYKEVSSFIMNGLKECSDCYPVYTPEWAESLENQLKTKGGNFLSIVKDGEIKSVFAYITNISKNESGDAVSEKVVEFSFPKEAAETELVCDRDSQRFTHVMARTVNVPAMFSHLSGVKEFVLAVKVYDERLTENAGLYLLHCGPVGGAITALKIGDASLTNASGEKLTAECEITIENLTRFCFGYKNAKDCFKVYVKSKEEEVLGNLDALVRIKNPEFLC